MRKLGVLALVVLMPLIAFAADPTVTQNEPLTNFNNTLNISATITPARGQTLGNAHGVVRVRKEGVYGPWVTEAYLGKGAPPFRGNTGSIYPKDTVVQTGIIVEVTENGVTRTAGIFDIKTYTVK